MSDAFLDGPVRGDREAVWRARFAGPIVESQITVVAEPDAAGRTAGAGLLGFCCILAGHDPSWGSLIDNLHVRPGSSRLRLGRRLLADAASRLLDGPHSGQPLHLTVLDGNLRAIAAYERWGGTHLERLTKQEPDGASHALRRYGWADPADLMTRLRDPA